MVSDEKIFSCFLNISLCKTCDPRGGNFFGSRDIISTKLLLTFCFLLLPLWNSVIVLCFVIRYFMSILVLQSSWLVALLNSSSWCLLMVKWLFLAVPWGCLGFVIVVFLDHTHLLFLVEVGYLLLHTKNQGLMSCGFRQEDLKVFISKI